MSPDFEINLPGRYGTNKCFDCGAEPEGLQPFWERFVVLHGKQVSVLQCDVCMAKMYAENEGAKVPKPDTNEK